MCLLKDKHIPWLFRAWKILSIREKYDVSLNIVLSQWLVSNFSIKGDSRINLNKQMITYGKIDHSPDQNNNQEK